MEEIIDLIAVDSSPSNISDKVKEVLFAKAAEKIENMRPEVATALFGVTGDEDLNTSEDNN
jgi:hypothetical protein